MNIQEMKDIIYLVITSISILVIILQCMLVVIKRVKNGKLNKFESTADTLISQVSSFMQEVETMTGLTGAVKRELVMNKAWQYCINKGIEFDNDKVSDIIENLVTFSKNVNAK